MLFDLRNDFSRLNNGFINGIVYMWWVGTKHNKCKLQLYTERNAGNARLLK